jgi:hypothetical protein
MPPPKNYAYESRYKYCISKIKSSSYFKASLISPILSPDPGVPSARLFSDLEDEGGELKKAS